MIRSSPVLPLIGGGTTKFQPVCVGDIITGLLELLRRSDTAGKTYEFGGLHVYSFRPATSPAAIAHVSAFHQPLGSFLIISSLTLIRGMTTRSNVFPFRESAMETTNRRAQHCPWPTCEWVKLRIRSSDCEHPSRKPFASMNNRTLGRTK